MVDGRCEVADVNDFNDFNSLGVVVTVYDCGVVDQVLTCECSGLSLFHVCFDGSVLFVHREAS